MQLLNADSLKAHVAHHNPQPCRCSLGNCKDWESFTEDRWAKGQMQALGTLRDPDIYEPTQEEFHPQGTRYASPEALIAVKFFHITSAMFLRTSLASGPSCATPSSVATTLTTAFVKSMPCL